MRLRVDHGALFVQNGFTHYPQRRQEWRLFPGDRRLPARIVMLDGDGALSFDVLAWLSRQGIPLVQLDWHGQVVTVAGEGGRAADPALREAQLAARETPLALALATRLVRDKILGCQDTLRGLSSPLSQERAHGKLDHAIGELDSGPPASLEQLRLIEGRAALAYFTCWQSLPLRWKGTGRKPIPEDWQRVGLRQSLVSGTNRHATHPVNAILNYAYGMLESQVRTAVTAAGLDPTLGYLHACRPGRVALVYDVMEPLRPKVDRQVLAFVGSRKFSAADFNVTDSGVCRLHPQLARAVATLTVEEACVRKEVDRIIASFVEVVQSDSSP